MHLTAFVIAVAAVGGFFLAGVASAVGAGEGVERMFAGSTVEQAVQVAGAVLAAAFAYAVLIGDPAAGLSGVLPL